MNGVVPLRVDVKYILDLRLVSAHINLKQSYLYNMVCNCSLSR